MCCLRQERSPKALVFSMANCCSQLQIPTCSDRIEEPGLVLRERLQHVIHRRCVRRIEAKIILLERVFKDVVPSWRDVDMPCPQAHTSGWGVGACVSACLRVCVFAKIHYQRNACKSAQQYDFRLTSNLFRDTLQSCCSLVTAPTH